MGLKEIKERWVEHYADSPREYWYCDGCREDVEELVADLEEALDFISKVRPSQYLHSYVPGHPETVGEEERIRDAQARILEKHGMEEQ